MQGLDAAELGSQFLNYFGWKVVNSVPSCLCQLFIRENINLLKLHFLDIDTKSELAEVYTMETQSGGTQTFTNFLSEVAADQNK